MDEALPIERERELFYEGISHFNRQEFFEAHEAWEDAWRNVYGKHKLFYQGLIQCAVSLEHLRRGNSKGARSLFRNCHKKFATLPRHYMGIEIWSLLEAIARTMASQPGFTSGDTEPPDLVWPTIQPDPDPFATGEAESRRTSS